MLNRFKIALVAVLATCGLTLVGASPAHAVNNAGPWTKGFGITKTSLSGAKITSHVDIRWRDQNDGTGVRVEQIILSTPDGCSLLEGGGNDAYSLTSAQLRNDNTGALLHDKTFTGYSGDGWDCYTSWDVEWPGKETGGATFQVHFKVRVDNGPDYYVTMQWDIHDFGGGLNIDNFLWSAEFCSDSAYCKPVDDGSTFTVVRNNDGT